VNLRFLKMAALVAAIVFTTMVGQHSRVLAQDPPPEVDILVIENVGVADNSGAVPPIPITASEEITVSDDAVVVGPVVITVAENVTVSDEAVVVGPVTILINETITVTDTGGPVNTSPIVEAGPPLTIDEGQTATLSASVIVLDPQLTTALVDWGDGSPEEQIIPTADGAIDGTHLYSSDEIFTVSVTVAGLFGDAVTDTTQVDVVNLPPVVETAVPYTIDLADPVATAILTAIASDPGGDPLTYAWDLDGDGQFDDATGQAALAPYTTVGAFVSSVEVEDDSGAATVQAYSVTVVDTSGDGDAPPAGEDDPSEPDSDDDSGDEPDDADDTESSNESAPPETGKVFGRAVIGRLISMSNIEIVVAANIGADFSNVRVHVDSAATDIAAPMDAEAYTTGSKVVVVADRDVLSGESIAITIRAIPGTASRKHERVIVSKTGDGNAAVLVSGDDDSGSSSVIKDEVGQFNSGDQVVVIKHRDDSNRRNEKPKVVVNNNDIKDRLEEFAQQKFDDGDSSGSGLIDRLEEKRRVKEQERIDEAKTNADEAVRRAAELAEEKTARAAEKAAADPATAVRKKAVAEAENEIIDCASQTVGRTIDGKDDLNDEELARVQTACLGDTGGSGSVPEERDDKQIAAPPPEILDCVAQVLGGVPDRGLTDEEIGRVKQACAPDDEDDGQDEKSADEKKQERQSDEAVDARKIAFCESNPSDSHCGGASSGSSGQKDGESPDSKDIESGSEEDKKIFCSANPTDERCGGDSGDSKDGDRSGSDDASKDESGTREESKSESDPAPPPPSDSKDSKDSGSKPAGK
jgi:hypothetical protein